MSTDDDSEMYTAKIVRNGRSQAIRLLKELRFDDDQEEVLVRKEGRRLVIEPLDAWSDAFLETEGSMPDLPAPPRRRPLAEARDSFEP